MSRTAVVAGATGLIGGFLTKELLHHEYWSSVKVLSRKTTGLNHPKLTEILMSEFNADSIRQHLNGHDLFICIGTTIKKAGSQQVFSATDLDLPVNIATVAHQQGVEHCSVVSSLGASVSSSNFYLFTKGKMESALQGVGFKSLHIMRPSMLLGPRKESRPGETIGKILMQTLGFLFIGPMRKYKVIEAAEVAKVMALLVVAGNPSGIFESDRIGQIAKKGLP